MRRELLLIGLLVAAVLLGSGAYWWRAQAPVAVVTPASGVAGITVTNPKALPVEPTKISEVTIHLSGAVRQPGLHVLPGGSRLSDAVRLAGGSLPDADLDAVNLAAPVLDGQKYTIPTKGQANFLPGPVPTVAGKINVNLADSKTLEQLPGIGEARAKAIVDYRQKNGAFQSVEDLKKISGIGDKTLEQLRDQVTVR